MASQAIQHFRNKFIKECLLSAGGNVKGEKETEINLKFQDGMTWVILLPLTIEILGNCKGEEDKSCLGYFWSELSERYLGGQPLQLWNWRLRCAVRFGYGFWSEGKANQNLLCIILLSEVWSHLKGFKSHTDSRDNIVARGIEGTCVWW